MRLEGKKILITGGGSGIGLELARRLAQTNTVVIAGRDECKLERARAEMPALRTLRLDVTSEEEAQRAIEWISSELGGLDLLVNSAGIIGGNTLFAPGAADTSVAEVETNLIGPIRLTRLALPLLETASKGGVMFMSSAVALTAVPGLAVYAATKAALHSLARSLRAELADKQIRVFEVLPPVVDTEFVRDLEVPKIPAAVVVDAIVAGLERDREEIRIARVKQLALLARVSPRLADRIVLRALRPSASASAG
jgi:uncharacterized oxidoreductase